MTHWLLARWCRWVGHIPGLIALRDGDHWWCHACGVDLGPTRLEASPGLLAQLASEANRAAKARYLQQLGRHTATAEILRRRFRLVKKTG